MKKYLRMAGWLLAAPLALASPGQLVILLDDSTEMPLASLQGATLLAGIHLDLGQALASELGKQASFRVLPRKRIGSSLQNGDADLVCLYLPEWLPGPFRWSRPFLPNAKLTRKKYENGQPGFLDNQAINEYDVVHELQNFNGHV